MTDQTAPLNQRLADAINPVGAFRLVLESDSASALPYLAKLSDDRLTAVGRAALQLAQLVQATQQQRARETPETQT